MSTGSDISAAIDSAIDSAIEHGLAFLERSQREDGEFPNLYWEGPADPVWQQNVFPAALIHGSLSFVPGSDLIRERAVDFLAGEMGPGGLWMHWSRRAAGKSWFPYDSDDTAWASIALRAAGRHFPDNRGLLLANRDRRGRFHTWFVLRPRWPGLALLRIILPRRAYVRPLVTFFVRTGGSIDDVDAVVNANVLAYLGRSPETEPAALWLLDLLRRGAECDADKWYPSRFAIWYFLARALGSDEEARTLLLARLASTRPESPLDFPLAACTSFYLGAAPGRALIEALLERQGESGGWPADTLYIGDHCRWGSEQLTTAFALEALARWRSERAE